jgi:hypothetical protein
MRRVFLSRNIEGATDAGRVPGREVLDALARRVIPHLTVTPAMEVLINNGMSPAVFQNKFVVMIGRGGELRVATYGFVRARRVHLGIGSY